MPRPAKYNLQYFPLDVDAFEDHKILSIEEDFGVKGGYIAIRILAMVYKDKGYYLDWPEKFEYTAAKRVGNGFTGALVGEILKSCIKHRLFDRNLYETQGIITSMGIQKRWLEVMKNLRRKISIERKFWLVSSEETPITSEETQENDEETVVLATLSTQKEIKVNEKKVNEIKTESLAAKPPPVKKDFKIEQPTEPFWDILVGTWFEFGKIKFGSEPAFAGRRPRIFKDLLQLLKKHAAKNNVVWNEKNAPQYLKIFLEKAYAIEWLKRNFTLPNLETQFDVIAQNQQSKANKATVTDLQYLYERFCEGDLDTRLLLPAHFEELNKKSAVTIDQRIIQLRMKSLEGSNQFSETELYKGYQSGGHTKMIEEDKPNLMRIAVIEYFKKIKSKTPCIPQT